jgi:sulfur carrier protein ThiS
MTSVACVHVTLKLYASLIDHLPPEVRNTHRLPLTLPAGTTISEVIGRQNLPLKLCHLVLVNGVYVPPAERATRALDDDDELAIWPPVAGG